jgi:excisionase family DNA binding protein
VAFCSQDRYLDEEVGVFATARNEGQGLDDLGIMTTGDVAKFLKVGVGAVRRWTREGKLKGHRLGGKGDWRYLRKDVMDFLYSSN